MIKLKKKILLKLLKEKGWAGFLFGVGPRAASYNFNYEQMVELTNFSGSRGIYIETPEDKFMIVDGRYTKQAKQECPECLVLDFQNLPMELLNQPLAIDPRLHCPKDLSSFNNKVFLEPNFWDCWRKEFEDFTEYPLKFSGPRRKVIFQEPYFITNFENLSWFAGIRNYSRAQHKNANLFGCIIDNKTEILEITAIEKFITKNNIKKIFLESEACPFEILHIFANHKIELVNCPDPIYQAKALKNSIEQFWFTKQHQKEGANIIKLGYWLTKNWDQVDEYEISQRFTLIRQKIHDFQGNSFNDIIGARQNSGIIHYRPTKTEKQSLKDSSWVLLDLGGHYWGATTDMTRVMFNPKIKLPADYCKWYTLVLKSHIALASYVFDQGTTGHDLDKIARQILREKNYSYPHSTGHGVGNFLNVHEWPPSLAEGNLDVVQEGMITSIEPGYYNNDFGIRIENLYVIKRAGSKLRFTNLTQVPLFTKPVIYQWLNKSELEWLKTYNQEVLMQTAPFLELEEINWVKENIL